MLRRKDGEKDIEVECGRCHKRSSHRGVKLQLTAA